LNELKREEVTGWHWFVGEVKAAWRRFGLALHVPSRAAVGSALHGSVIGGAAVPMEARGGSQWKPEVGADGETKMGQEPRRLQHKLFLFLNFKQDFRFKNQSLKYFGTEFELKSNWDKLE
jgi:hypothetical protein